MGLKFTVLETIIYLLYFIIRFFSLAFPITIILHNAFLSKLQWVAQHLKKLKYKTKLSVFAMSLQSFVLGFELYSMY